VNRAVDSTSSQARPTRLSEYARRFGEPFIEKLHTALARVHSIEAPLASLTAEWMQAEKNQKPVEHVAVGASNGSVGFTSTTNGHHLHRMSPFSLYVLEELGFVRRG
jgi:hypothetical protein